MFQEHMHAQYAINYCNQSQPGNEAT